MSHKRQHYIPRFYLDAWRDPATPLGQEPYVWMISKDGKEIRNKAPKKIFRETDLYTFEVDDSRDLSIETSLAQVESEFAAIRREKLEPMQPINLGDRLWICSFVVSMYARTLVQRDRWQDVFKELAEKAEGLMEWSKTATEDQLRAMASTMSPEEVDDSHTFTLDEMQALSDQPMPEVVRSQVSILVPILFQMNLGIICTKTKPGFLTSDDPCTWVDPNYPGRRALVSPSIEIHMPVSPTQALFFTHQKNPYGVSGYLYLDKVDRLEDIKAVTEANQRIVENAGEYVISCSQSPLASWFNYK